MGWGVHSCGTVALMVLGQFSNICGPQIKTANIRKLAKEHKGYGSAAKVFSATFNIILAIS